MKKISLFILAFLVLVPQISFAVVNVRGYYRSNGTYVAPHVRSNPNGLKSDNYSYKGGDIYNPSYFTSKTPGWQTPTTITDPYYYQGLNAYQNKTTVPNYMTPSYNKPAPSYTSPYSYPSSYSVSTPSYFDSTNTTVTKTPHIVYYVPEIVKLWVDQNPNTSCSKSDFLRKDDIAICKKYKDSDDKAKWITTSSSKDYPTCGGKYYKTTACGMAKFVCSADGVASCKTE